MNEPPLVSGLIPLLEVLERIGVRHYVGGSLASSVHGVPRASIDADVLAELRTDHLARFLDGLGDDYYVSEERVRGAVARRTSFNAIHLATMVKVDVFVAKDRAFDRSALERARPETIEGAHSRPVPLATAEDIVLAKLEWYRKGGEVSQQQWTDVQGVLRAGADAIDRGYLRQHAVDLEVTDLLERALTEATAVR